jgi:hypothetical protein
MGLNFRWNLLLHVHVHREVFALYACEGDDAGCGVKLWWIIRTRHDSEVLWSILSTSSSRLPGIDQILAGVSRSGGMAPASGMTRLQFARSSAGRISKQFIHATVAANEFGLTLRLILHALHPSTCFQPLGTPLHEHAAANYFATTDASSPLLHHGMIIPKISNTQPSG